MNELHLDHPSPEELTAFVVSELAADHAAAVGAHIAQCPHCREVLDQLSGAQLPQLFQARSQVHSDRATRLPAAVGGETTVLSDAQADSLLSQAGEPALPYDGPPELADHPRYHVLAKLGEGGMGVVYKAEHKLMERPVALKVI